MECPSGQILVLYTYKFNYCVDQNSDEYYFLKPIANYNEKLYVIQNKNECGLCKDLNFNKQYKIINRNQYIDEKPKNKNFAKEKKKMIVIHIIEDIN